MLRVADGAQQPWRTSTTLGAGRGELSPIRKQERAFERHANERDVHPLTGREHKALVFWDKRPVAADPSKEDLV